MEAQALPSLVSDSAVLPPLFAAGFVWLSLAIGRRLLIWLGARRDGSPSERGVVAVALGIGVLQLVPLSLGAAGVLGARSLRIAIAVLAVAFARDLWAVADRMRDALRRWPRPAPWLIAWVLSLLPILLFTSLFTLTPTIDADGVNYHLTVPKRWMQSGSLDYLPTYPYSNAPMGAEMLYAIGMAFAGDVAAKCVHYALGVLGAAGLYLAGKRLRGSVVGAVAATSFLVGPFGCVGLFGSAYIEGVTACAMVAAALALVVFVEGRERGWLRCAAVLAGVAVCCKITVAFFPVALGALAAFLVFDEARKAGLPGRRALAAVAREWAVLPLAIAPLLPWLVRAALVTGNPFFPVFARWIPSRDLSPLSAAQVETYYRYMLWGTGIGAGWTLGQRKLVLLGFALAAVVAVAAVFPTLRSRAARAAAVVLLFTVVVQAYAVGLYVRYWIPLAAVLALPLLAWMAKPLSRRLVPAALVIVTLFAGARLVRRGLQHGDGQPFELKGLLRTAAGIADRRDFLRRQQPLFPIYERVNRDLPSNARILLSYYCGAFYIDRTTYCGEFVQDSLRFASWEQFSDDVRRLGVTHVIAPTVLATGGAAPPLFGASASMVRGQQESELIRRLLEGSRLVASAADEGLYEIEAGASARSR